MKGGTSVTFSSKWHATECCNIIEGVPRRFGFIYILYVYCISYPVQSQCVNWKFSCPNVMWIHQNSSMCATFRYLAHINVIVEFLPHPLQHFRCDGLHSTIDSVLTGQCSPTFPSQSERFGLIWSFCNDWLGMLQVKMPPFSGGHPRPPDITPCDFFVWRGGGRCEWHGLCLEQNLLCCGDHHIWNAVVGVAGILLLHWCALGNERCAHRGTLMDAHKIWTVKLLIDTCNDCIR
jgi:hypothetical protein